ncbi:hypothetical protein BGX38DRAFT_49134 [Terfezia claveryi]|nr:hypothetical protein BGX38DRAFT_49134 [Terfezia claveryi]
MGLGVEAKQTLYHMCWCLFSGPPSPPLPSPSRALAFSLLSFFHSSRTSVSPFSSCCKNLSYIINLLPGPGLRLVYSGHSWSRSTRPAKRIGVRSPNTPRRKNRTKKKEITQALDGYIFSQYPSAVLVQIPSRCVLPIESVLEHLSVLDSSQLLYNSALASVYRIATYRLLSEEFISLTPSFPHNPFRLGVIPSKTTKLAGSTIYKFSFVRPLLGPLYWVCGGSEKPP